MKTQANLEEKLSCFNKGMSLDASCEGLQMQDISGISLDRVENIRSPRGVHKESEDEKEVTNKDEKEEEEAK